jgi:enamine deaminase RidA (YjgF/YER057c/UK114 family)
VLRDAGADRAQVVKTTVYLLDIEDWGELDEIYGRFFGDTRPARSVVPTGPLHFGFRIEIEAIALVGGEA